MDVPKPRPPLQRLTAEPLNTGPAPLAALPRKKSRCTIPRKDPLTWVYYAGNGGSVLDDINAVTATLLPPDRELVLGLVEEKGKLAAAGAIEDDGDDLKPVSFDPEMWELRYEFDGVLYRLYFAEPYTHPAHLIALRFHVKSLEGAQAEIDAAQEAEMAVAAMRFKAGERDEWGSAA